jgi:hypothetical protein
MRKTAAGVYGNPKTSAEPPQTDQGFVCTWRTSFLHVLADGEPCFPDGRNAVARIISLLESRLSSSVTDMLDN